MKIKISDLKRMIREVAKESSRQTLPPFTGNSPSELSAYVVTNWKALTGLPEKAMHEESDFPEVVWQLVSENGFDEMDFQDAWTEYLG